MKINPVYSEFSLDKYYDTTFLYIKIYMYIDTINKQITFLVHLYDMEL